MLFHFAAARLLTKFVAFTWLSFNSEVKEVTTVYWLTLLILGRKIMAAGREESVWLDKPSLSWEVSKRAEGIRVSFIGR